VYDSLSLALLANLVPIMKLILNIGCASCLLLLMQGRGSGVNFALPAGMQAQAHWSGLFFGGAN
jgi:hypothetical protein